MEFNKKGILGRAKEAAQQSTTVTDEGLSCLLYTSDAADED